MKKIFLRFLPLSRFLAKTLRVNKPAMKKFLENLSFGVDIKLYVHLRIKLTHTTWVVWGANPDWKFVTTNYVCMYGRSLDQCQLAIIFTCNPIISCKVLTSNDPAKSAILYERKRILDGKRESFRRRHIWQPCLRW